MSKIIKNLRNITKDKKSLAIIAVFAVTGAVLLFKSFAATSSASFEAENGTLTGNASTLTDSTASGGKYITFTQSTSDNCNVAAPAGYTTRTLCDDFNDTTLNSNLWNKDWFSPKPGTTFSKPVNSADREDDCNDSRNVSISDGSLILTTGRTTDPNCTDRNGNPVTYTASIVTSLNKFDQAHGYFEARIYMSGTGGKIYNWPTFWTNGYHGTWADKGENDIAEINSDHYPNQHYHYGASPNDKSYNHVVQMDGTGWHTYATKWEVGKITWYIDGAQVASTTTGVLDDPHYILFDNKFNKTDSNSTYSHITGQPMKIDWIRVWK